MEEVYKQIITYPDYEISNFGNCRNSKTTKILKPQKMKIGYFQYSLSRTNEEGKRIQEHIYQHRLIALCHIDNPSNKTDIDHIDNNPSNNDITNLRWCSKSENLRNQKKAQNKSSIFKGVYFKKDKNKWCSKIEVNKIIKNLGSFDNEMDAVIARDTYILEHNLDDFFKIQVL